MTASTTDGNGSESPAQYAPTLFPELTTHDVMVRGKAHYTPNYRQAPVVLTRGEGVWLWDRDGKRYLDMVAGIAVCSLGYSHPRLSRAVADQANTLIHTSGLFHNEPAVALMDELTRVSFADRVFFANSGAEANEAALKLAKRYRSVVKGQPERNHVLAFNKSFHGRTLATISVTGQPKYHKGFEPLVPGIHFADFGDLEGVTATLDRAEGKIATLIIEPIQCEGGLNMPPDAFLRGLRKLCDERDMVLIFDEVQTGVARTGEWFCYEHYDVTPDIMSLAKGIGGGVPLGAMLAREEVAQAFQPGTHASTFGGNPLATRAGYEVLRTIEDDNLLDHIYETGQYLEKQLRSLIKTHSDKCVEQRGVGLLRGLQLEGDLAKEVVGMARDRGMLLNTIAGHTLRMVPPLIIQPGHIDVAVEIIDDCLKSL